ncbi:MAG: hypothetical protein QM640_15010 [Niabella sp.]
MANYSKEPGALKGKKNVYFSNQSLSPGILEGIQYYLNRR